MGARLAGSDLRYIKSEEHMDVLDRIRRVETQPLHGTEAWVDLWETLQCSRAEIERLREVIRRLADQDATLSVCGGNVTVTMDATLTDAEREAVEAILADADSAWSADNAATLRGLLKRLGGAK